MATIKVTITSPVVDITNEEVTAVIPTNSTTATAPDSERSAEVTSDSATITIDGLTYKSAFDIYGQLSDNPLANLRELVSLSERIGFEFYKELSDSFTLSDAFEGLLGVPFDATPDVTTLTDTASFVIGKGIADSMTILDPIELAVTKNIQELQVFFETISKIFGKALSDNFSVSDVLTVSISSSKTDSFSISDLTEISVNANKSDTMTVSDSATMAIDLDAGYNESPLTIYDTVSLSMTLAFQDTITFTEDFSTGENVWNPDYYPGDETAYFTDVLELAFTKGTSDSIILTEDYTMGIGKVNTETVTLSEILLFEVSSLLIDTLTLSENISILFESVLPSDTISLSDVLEFSLDKDITESFSLLEVFAMLFESAKTDSITLSESGLIVLQDYASDDYFASDYTGSTTTF